MRVPGIERAAIVLVPAVALATVALGLRAGASSRTLGARVYAASPGHGRAGLSLQLVTLVEEGGVPEVVALPRLTVVGSAHGQKAEWRGASNSEGVAEVWLDLSDLRAPEPIELSVDSDGVTVAAGTITVPPAEPAPSTKDPFVPAMRRSGDLVVDLLVYGGTLVPGAATDVVVEVRDRAGRGVDGVAVALEPEPGLRVDSAFPPTAAGGWTSARVTAEFLTAACTISVTPPGTSSPAATWYGPIPVSPGGAIVDLPTTFAADTPHPLALAVPPASPRLYVEVLDSQGRDFGAAIDLTRQEAGRATAVLPPLAPGVYWLVTSSDARGAESMTATTVARPFRVRAGEAERAPISELARLAPPHVTRALSLDGLAAPHRRADRARRRALMIALGALVVATILEALLILRAAGRSRDRLQRVSEEALSLGLGELEAPATRTGARVRVAVLMLVTLLGFALVALLLLDRGR